MAAASHTCGPACQCASHILQHTPALCAHLALHGTGEQALKNPVVVPAALKNRVLMSSCFLPLSLYPCVGIFLFISDSRLSFFASHTFSVS